LLLLTILILHLLREQLIIQLHRLRQLRMHIAQQSLFAAGVRHARVRLGCETRSLVVQLVDGRVACDVWSVLGGDLGDSLVKGEDGIGFKVFEVVIRKGGGGGK
jgi:hypothetical protein